MSAFEISRVDHKRLVNHSYRNLNNTFSKGEWGAWGDNIRQDHVLKR